MIMKVTPTKRRGSIATTATIVSEDVEDAGGGNVEPGGGNVESGRSNGEPGGSNFDPGGSNVETGVGVVLTACNDGVSNAVFSGFTTAPLDSTEILEVLVGDGMNKVISVGSKVE